METLSRHWTTYRFSMLTVALSALAGAGLAVVVGRFPEYALPALGGLLALAPLIAGVWARFHAATLFAFAILGVVRWEPAPVDLLLLLLLGLGLVNGTLAPTQLGRSSLIHSGLWLFGTINLIGLFIAVDRGYSMFYTAVTLYLIAFAYFLKLYVDSVDRMRLVLIGYLVAALLSVTLVGLEWAGLSGTREFFVFEQRARALFKDTNVYAPFLIIPLIWLLDELIRPHLLPGGYWWKALAIVALGAGVFISFSRAAWANLAVTVLLYVLLMASSLTFRQWMRLVVPGILGAGALAALLIRLNLITFLFSRATPLQSYDSERFGTQAAGIEAGLSNLFGIGAGMLYDAHSLYVRTFAEYGVFGLLALMTVLFAPLLGSLRRAFQPDDRVYGLSARVVAAFWSGLLLNGVVIDTIHWRHFWISFAFAWIVAVAPLETVRRRR